MSTKMKELYFWGAFIPWAMVFSFNPNLSVIALLFQVICLILHIKELRNGRI